MPKKKDAKVLGRAECSCGKTMAVLQNVRWYLYTNCPECGCDQRNGAKHQTDLWNRTKWIDGEPENRPINYIESGGETPEKQPEPKPDEPEKPDPKQPVKKSKGWGFLLVPAGVLLAVALGGR